MRDLGQHIALQVRRCSADGAPRRKRRTAAARRVLVGDHQFDAAEPRSRKSLRGAPTQLSSDGLMGRSVIRSRSEPAMTRSENRVAATRCAARSSTSPRPSAHPYPKRRVQIQDRGAPPSMGAIPCASRPPLEPLRDPSRSTRPTRFIASSASGDVATPVLRALVDTPLT